MSCKPPSNSMGWAAAAALAALAAATAAAGSAQHGATRSELASEVRLQDAFSTLQHSISAARAAAPEQRPAIRQVSALAVSLQGRAASLPAEAKVDYARSIEHQAAVLSAVPALPAGGRGAAIADVADDLALKDARGPGAGAGSRNPGYVALRVVTRRHGKEIKGYAITLNPMRYRDKNPYLRLGPLTPSTGRVTPGRYEVTAWRGGAIAAREVFRIGLTAENEFTAELAVS